MKKGFEIPERYEDWNEIEFDKIKKGDYVAYYTKPFKYQNGEKKEGAFRSGGYVTIIENDNTKKFIGLKNSYGKLWTIQDENIEFYLISPSSVKSKKTQKT